jgi:phosphoglycolate phosphatase-like HAD superfamily hydrolase
LLTALLILSFKLKVFLGMAASSVPVRPDVPNMMEDLTAAGIRFVYFSPRNMKRSKPVAEKIGISFDWNCAISLRDLHQEETSDPHRQGGIHTNT